MVQQRLGHKRIEMTLSIYAHVLPSMQQDAARRRGALLHGQNAHARRTHQLSLTSLTSPKQLGEQTSGGQGVVGLE